VPSLAGVQSRLGGEVADALGRRQPGELFEHAAMVALIVFWAVPFTRATGGRGVHSELVLSAVALLVLLAMRAWRAPTPSLVLAALVAAAAELVCVFAPSGWYGSDVAAAYVLAAACFIAARRYVQDDERRVLVAACVCIAGLYQFEQAFVPWWGSETASTVMSGTFYWHNPYAAFLLPGAVIGLGLVLSQRRPWTAVGWLSTPLCTAGIVFSSSRATMVALLLSWLLVVAFGVRGKRSIRRTAGVFAVSAVVVLALPGPPFFPDYTAPWTATEARAASGETLSQNGGYRIQFWRSALEVAVHRPWVGSGYHELADASALYTPFGWARSPQAHNGYLQAVSDGGLLLGVPLIGAVFGVLWWALRRLWSITRARPGPDELIVLSVAAAALGMLAHSAVDFDWSHPSILVEVALLAAVAAPATRPTRTRRRSIAAFAVLGAALVVMLPALHQWQQAQPNLTNSTDHELAVASATFGNFRPAETILYAYVRGERPLSTEQAARALELTADEAAVDIHNALLRYAVGASTGLIPDAVARARATLDRIGGVFPPYVPDFALVLSSAGDKSGARAVLARHIDAQVASGDAAPNLRGELLQWARTLGTGADYACRVVSVRPLLSAADISRLPLPTSRCPDQDQGHA
jgi:O-antigen ligase